MHLVPACSALRLNCLGFVLSRFHEAVEIVGGLIVILLGLNFLGVIKIPFLKGIHTSHNVNGIFSAFVFGIVFSVSHIPCVGAFLGASLMTASASASIVKGTMLLLSYSLGMGIPFLISAMVVDKLKNTFKAIENNYKTINLVCGIFLIVLGVCMATGLLHEALHLI